MRKLFTKKQHHGSKSWQYRSQGLLTILSIHHQFTTIIGLPVRVQIQDSCQPADGFTPECINVPFVEGSSWIVGIVALIVKQPQKQFLI